MFVCSEIITISLVNVIVLNTAAETSCEENVQDLLLSHLKQATRCPCHSDRAVRTKWQEDEAQFHEVYTGFSSFENYRVLFLYKNESSPRMARCVGGDAGHPCLQGGCSPHTSTRPPTQGLPKPCHLGDF